MRDLDFSTAAGRDLAKIRAESREGWGHAHAERYLAELRRRMERLRSMPQLGQAFGAIRPGLRRLVVRSHIILYRFDDRAVIIVRILHQHMDVPRHLGDGS